MFKTTSSQLYRGTFKIGMIVAIFPACIENERQNKSSSWHAMKICEPGPRLNIKTVFPRYGIPMLKIRRSRDRFFFTMGIPILVKHIYTETVSCFLNKSYAKKDRIAFFKRNADPLVYSPQQLPCLVKLVYYLWCEHQCNWYWFSFRGDDGLVLQHRHICSLQAH